MYYKRNAEDYHKNSSEQLRLAKEFIAKLGLKGDERILDIGCGDGKITAELARLVPNGSVLGIDCSEDMVNFASRKFPPTDFPNLRFQHEDAKNLHFENEFDSIVSFTCLHWIADHTPVLEGIRNSLKPDGKIQLLFAGKPENDSCTRVFIEKMIGVDKWGKYFEKFMSTPFGLYKADEYKDLLECVGLKSNRVEAITTNMIFQGKEEFKGLIRTTWLPLFSSLPEDLHQELIDAITETYIECIPLDREGFLYMPIVKLEVEARKKVETDHS